MTEVSNAKSQFWQRTVPPLVQAFLPSTRGPVIVASMGRAGSTLLFRAVTDAMTRRRFGWTSRLGRALCAGVAFDLAGTRLRPGVVYKTHGYPDEIAAVRGLSVVYVFSRASAIATSVVSCEPRYGRAWVDLHLQHVRADGPFEDITRRDVLRLEDQYTAWLQTSHSFPVLALRYENLWENVDALSDFLKLKVALPPRRDRLSGGQVDESIAAALDDIYRDLDARIERVPHVQVLGGV